MNVRICCNVARIIDAAASFMTFSLYLCGQLVIRLMPNDREFMEVILILCKAISTRSGSTS